MCSFSRSVGRGRGITGAKKRRWTCVRILKIRRALGLTACKILRTKVFVFGPKLCFYGGARGVRQWVENRCVLWGLAPPAGPILGLKIAPFLGSKIESFWLQNDAILNLKMTSERSRKQITDQQFNSSQINRSQINRSADYRSTDSQTRDQQIYQIHITD